MKSISRLLVGTKLLVVVLCLVGAGGALGQVPQDHWYLSQTRSYSGLPVSSGGLASPYGSAVGPDGRIYVGDQGNECIQVYLTNGLYSFSISGGFGSGLSFSQPRGMITDSAGNLYVADLGNNCVYKFTSSGVFSMKFGSGAGSGPGQLSGAIDVGVDLAGFVYVCEYYNARVSLFNPDGSFNRVLIGPGSLQGQLWNPTSLAVSDSGKVFVAQGYLNFTTDFGGYPPNCPCANIYLKEFDSNGNFINWVYDVGYSLHGNDGCGNTIWLYYAPSSVRLDSSGLVHVIQSPIGSWYVCGGDWGDPNVPPFWQVFNQELSLIQNNSVTPYTSLQQRPSLLWPCTALSPDGTMILCAHENSALQVYSYAKREIQPKPRNAASMPEVLSVVQRTNAAVFDIYFKITDLDDTNTFAAMLVFTNGTQSLSDCLVPSTFIEGTATNINCVVPANQVLHVAWNIGQDWPSTNLSNYRVGLLAKDLRQGLVEVHYLGLPADHGMGPLQISASPLIQPDFSQIWWWLLATNDPGIRLSNGMVYGVSGTNAGVVLCSGDNSTTSSGRQYIYAKMNVREATPAEVAWASLGPNLTITNQWAPGMSVAGRPKAVNEYRFDTGNWGSSAWWIVALP